MNNEIKRTAYQGIIEDWRKDIEKATKTIAELEHKFYGNITHSEYKDGMAMAKRTIEIAKGEIAKYEEKLQALEVAVEVEEVATETEEVEVEEVAVATTSKKAKAVAQEDLYVHEDDFMKIYFYREGKNLKLVKYQGNLHEPYWKVMDYIQDDVAEGGFCWEEVGESLQGDPIYLMHGGLYRLQDDYMFNNETKATFVPYKAKYIKVMKYFQMEKVLVSDYLAKSENWG